MVEIKGVRLSLRIGKHDRDIRLSQSMKFLEEGNKVRVELMLKGRERQYTPQGRQIIEEFVKDLGENVKIEQPLINQEGKLNTIIFLQK